MARSRGRGEDCHAQGKDCGKLHVDCSGGCFGSMSVVLVDGVDGELYLSWESSDFFTVLIHRLHRVHAFFQETTIAYCGLQARIKAGVVPLFQAQSATR